MAEQLKKVKEKERLEAEHAEELAHLLHEHQCLERVAAAAEEVSQASELKAEDVRTSTSTTRASRREA